MTAVACPQANPGLMETWSGFQAGSRTVGSDEVPQAGFYLVVGGCSCRQDTLLDSYLCSKTIHQFTRTQK
jgi:hypothetical protein